VEARHIPTFSPRSNKTYNSAVELPAAIFPAIATVTAAFIAAFVAFLSSVLSKEQKTSEFRYTWLNSVLDDIAKFAGAAESISTTAWSHFKSEGKVRAEELLASAQPQIGELIGELLAAYYRARIRLYPEEHQQVHQALENLQVLLLKGEVPDPAKVDPLVRDVVRVSHDALKEEWGRVKRGEMTFRLTKYISLTVVVVAILMAVGFAVLKALGH